ncbi:serpin B8 [Trichonephila inaurata madagascariensis]|uniref:Serpin B8 n=1 Tax=Trichonephila inaurata madagascariensis TaxID=2747483 RepID=A0A8X6YAM6_9ARAC|nr:serpin B8 [Trichonephila inaurata madagascariensis]
MEGAANLENLRKLASANNEFAFNMHRKLTEDTTENVFFSPLSVFSVFSMLYYGSVGETAEVKTSLIPKNQNLLRMDRFTNETVIHSANSVFVNKSTNTIPEFRRNIKEWYGASFQEVDFSKDSDKVIRSINDWAKDHTHQRIKHLIRELNPATLMILLNSIYFKGAWKTPFHQNNTETQDFFNNGQESGKK